MTNDLPRVRKTPEDFEQARKSVEAIRLEQYRRLVDIEFEIQHLRDEKRELLAILEGNSTSWSEFREKLLSDPEVRMAYEEDDETPSR